MKASYGALVLHAVLQCAARMPTDRTSAAGLLRKSDLKICTTSRMQRFTKSRCSSSRILLPRIGSCASSHGTELDRPCIQAQRSDSLALGSEVLCQAAQHVKLVGPLALVVWPELDLQRCFGSFNQALQVHAVISVRCRVWTRSAAVQTYKEANSGCLL